MKFKDGYMISSGQPVKDYIDSAVRHVLLRQVGLQFVQFLLSLGCWNLTWEVYNWHTGCSWYQGEDYAWLGSQGKAGPNNTSTRFGHNPSPQGGRGVRTSTTCIGYRYWGPSPSSSVGGLTPLLLMSCLLLMWCCYYHYYYYFHQCFNLLFFFFLRIVWYHSIVISIFFLWPLF